MSERLYQDVVLSNYKGRIRNRNRQEYSDGIELKNRATLLIPVMYDIYRSNKVLFAQVSLVGSVALNLSDRLSDFDYLIGSRTNTLSDVIRLIEITQDKVTPQIQSIAMRRIEMHYPFNKIFTEAFNASNRFRSAMIT